MAGAADSADASAQPDPSAKAADAAAREVESAYTGKPNVIRRMYEWVLGWADSPWAVPALFVLALAESSFFPIPPDVLLIALALSAPTKAFRFAIWCTLGSVVGGVIGYYLGWAMWSSVESVAFNYVFTRESFDNVMGIYRDHGVLFVFAAAFTPIPYKVFTIAAGVAELNLPAFIAASFVGRGARFFLVAGMIRLFGEKARELIDRYFNLLTIVGAALVIGAVLLLKVL